jgi:hypothetical protein
MPWPIPQGGRISPPVMLQSAAYAQDVIRPNSGLSGLIIQQRVPTDNCILHPNCKGRHLVSLSVGQVEVRLQVVCPKPPSMP